MPHSHIFSTPLPSFSALTKIALLDGGGKDNNIRGMVSPIKKYIVLIAAAVVALAAGGTAVARADEPSAPDGPAREQRAVIELSYKGERAVYEDRILPEPDHTVTQEFHERRINAPLGDKLALVEENVALGSSAKAAILYSFPLLERVVKNFIAKIEREPRDATMEFRPYSSPMFVITREKPGFSVNEKLLYYEIYNALRRSPAVKIEVKADELRPSVTADELKLYTVKRSTFSTDYSRSTENRKHNIRLALHKLDGVCIADGEEFSFNKAVGSRTAERGFQEAKIIVDGEYVDGTGGGVCQASTTLYNAALLGGLTVTKVSSHSLPPSYVPPSFDAMVNSGSSDLVLRNDTGGPVFIRAFGSSTTATVEFYGKAMPYKIVKESKVISRGSVPEDKIIFDKDNKYVSEAMLPGEKVRVRYGAAGLTSEGYLLYYENGVLTRRTLIRKDVYRSVRGLVAVKP